MSEWIDSGATLSPCRLYRYLLWRQWSTEPSVLWIMLNPSTADETVEDPTIRRCVGFARQWGFGGIYVANLFALRSTSPHLLYDHSDPVGPRNDGVISFRAKVHGKVACAWGVHGAFRDRGKQVIDLVRRVGGRPVHLGLTKAGHPRHPLYLAASTGPRDFERQPEEKGAA